MKKISLFGCLMRNLEIFIGLSGNIYSIIYIIAQFPINNRPQIWIIILLYVIFKKQLEYKNIL